MLNRTGAIDERKIILVDDKTMRGAKSEGADGGGVPHVLSALDQGAGAVVAQQHVADKSSRSSPP